MSRCFPFPPPGYETKARSDHEDLLAKEKHKEKKHKKEKRDREKREGNERKDKDRSKDKQKEKKDGKEKSRDKKKDKDRDKDKNRISEDRRIEERIEGHHEVKLGESSQRAEEVKNSKFTQELGRRIRDKEKGATNSMVENFTGSIQRRPEGMGAAAALEKGRVTGTEMLPNSIGTSSQRRNDGMGQQVDKFSDSIQRSEAMGTASALEKERGTGNNVAANLIGKEKRRNHGMGRAVDTPIGSMPERFQGMCTATAMEKESGADNCKVSNPIGTIVPHLIDTEQKRNHGMAQLVDNIVPRRVEGKCTASAMEKGGGRSNNMVLHPIGAMQGRNDGVGRPLENLTSSIPNATEKERDKGNQMVANLTGTEQRRNDGNATQKERDKRNQMVANLIGTEQRRNDGMAGSVGKETDKSMEGKEKTRDRDRNEKKIKGKDKDRQKEKEKEKGKMREKGEHRHKKENDNPKDSGKKNLINSLNIKPLAPYKDNANNAVTDGNIKKRKDVEMNGFLHEDDARPNKFPRTSSSSHVPLENGRTLESCHIATPSFSHGNITVLDNKEHKINGIAEPRPSSVDFRSPVAVDTSETKVSLKPPHPETKYLNQIYSVPKMEEWPESDDQEWLFSSDDLRSKPKIKLEAEETPQVWAEALQIESGDVMALPYVIPF